MLQECGASVEDTNLFGLRGIDRLGRNCALAICVNQGINYLAEG